VPATTSSSSPTTRSRLQAAQSTASEHSTNSASGSSIGVGLAIGRQQNGFTLDLAASRARGHADGDDATWANTHITAGKTAIVQSGGDTNIQGGVITAAKVVGNIGGNLNVESLQDPSISEANEQSAGVGSNWNSIFFLHSWNSPLVETEAYSWTRIRYSPVICRIKLNAKADAVPPFSIPSLAISLQEPSPQLLFS
jgi:hypothetical protein